jgi:hypothetical protein
MLTNVQVAEALEIIQNKLKNDKTPDGMFCSKCGLYCGVSGNLSEDLLFPVWRQILSTEEWNGNGQFSL